MTAALYLAVDGGNSKTDVVLGSATGEVLAFLRGPTSSPHLIGLPATIRLLDALVAEARAAAGLSPDMVIAQTSVFLAGADLPVEVQRLSKEIGAAGWSQRHLVDNDTFALLRAGTSTPDAVAVVCGAGINAVGRTADGRTARFPALGELSGDFGGGHDLAKLALWHAARGEDGRGPWTALSEAVAVHFGLSTVEEVSAALHLEEIDPDRIYELSPVLFAVAAAGDAVAASVVREQSDEILAMARVAADRLGLSARPHAVVLGGGVLRARHPLLHDAVLAGLREQAPLAEVTVVRDPPVAGAALLALDALDALGADPAAEPLVRAALRLPPTPATGQGRGIVGTTGIVGIGSPIPG
jgi:N-acetylglucosamine kinase-like BadF-type ATPase